MRQVAAPADEPQFAPDALADAKDSARYQWLRRFDHFAMVDAMLDTTEYNTLDAAVDAAMGGES